MEGMDFVTDRAKTVVHAALNGAALIDADIGSLHEEIQKATP